MRSQGDTKRPRSVKAEFDRCERLNQIVAPRRATTHDVGSGITHKRIICLKRCRDGKPSHEIARETYHSIEPVDRYLGQFDRVRHCRRQGLSPEQTAFTLSCGPSLFANTWLSAGNRRTEND